MYYILNFVFQTTHVSSVNPSSENMDSYHLPTEKYRKLQ